MNRNDMARSIFEDIRDQPYFVCAYPGHQAANCSFKGKQLLDRLGFLGFAVRGRIAEMLWDDTPLPPAIIALYPKTLLATHFYIEVQDEEGVWRAIDPSWDKGLVGAGFPLATWEGLNSPALPLVRVYKPEEQATYLGLWRDPDYISDYFDRAGDFLRATNTWLESVRV